MALLVFGPFTLLVAGCRCSPIEAAPIPAVSQTATASATPAAASTTPAHPPAAKCPAIAWDTYAADAARTSASPGCALGPYSVSWVWTPPSTRERESRAHHVIADPKSAYVVAVKGNSPSAYRLDVEGQAMWAYDSRADIQRAHWPSLGHGSLVLNDDGFYLLHEDTGRPRWDRGLDTWGQTLFDDERWYLVNTWHVEGPGVFVGAFDLEGKTLWKANKYGGSVKEDVMEDCGALALSDGVLFQAANYKFAPYSGVFAFEAKTGALQWSKPTMPVGDLSVGGGRLFSIEKEARGREPRLVARDTSTGQTSWQVGVPGVRAAAPVVAAGLVIVDRGDLGVFAYDAETGAESWRAAAGKRSERVPLSTTLAAALGTGTLVITAVDGVSIVSLADGSQRWSGAPGGLSDFHSPVIVGTRIYVIAGTSVVALDLAD